MITETSTKMCERCGVEITESNDAFVSPDPICQECWEQECSDAWWEMWPAISAIDAMIEAERVGQALSEAADRVKVAGKQDK